MTDLFDMTGKTVLITGGSRGLGRAMAQGFAEAGADIAIVSRKLDAPLPDKLRFHAAYRQAFPCEKGKYYEILKTDGGPGHFAPLDWIVLASYFAGTLAVILLTFIAPPLSGINKQPVGFEYVRFG
mgnify:CR=1 FL=1